MYTTVNGNPTYSVATTEGLRDWVTLIHPLGADLTVWDQVASSLGSHWNVLRYDLRSHGRTSGNTVTHISDLADDLQALLNARHIVQTHLVGLALGGMIALSFALRYPAHVKRMVLCNTSAAASTEQRRTLREQAIDVDRHGLDSIKKPTLASWLTADFRDHHPEVVEPLQDALLACSAPGYAMACKAMAAFDVRRRLPKIAAPTLIINTREHHTDSAGAEDGPRKTPTEHADPVADPRPSAAARVLMAGIPDAQLIEMQGAHLAAIEHPGIFARSVDEFLKTTNAIRDIPPAH